MLIMKTQFIFLDVTLNDSLQYPITSKGDAVNVPLPPAEFLSLLAVIEEDV